MSAATKRCPRCGERKPLSAFYQRRGGGPSGYCRPCQGTVSHAARQRRMQDPAGLGRLRARDRLRKRRRGGEAA
jgi:hypothetical protein